MDLTAHYDQLISVPIMQDGKEIGRKEHLHYTFGRPGDEVSGGFYIKKNTEIPDELILTLKKKE